MSGKNVLPRRNKGDADPKMIGLWRIGRTIGKGSSGRVRIARHSKTRQYAAVKIISKTSVLNSQTSLLNLEDEAERVLLAIEREIVIMKLIDHPNIMRLYDVWETSGELYLIMEYVEGGELFDYLCDKGKLSTAEACGYFHQIISAVRYCHRFNIAHRDLKPENLLLDRNKNIKVADFGMASWQKGGPNGLLQTACGSPHYAAPEVIMGKSYNGFMADIWSCGVILYALLAGKLPFDDDDLGVLLQKVKNNAYSMPHWFDPMTADLISKMLQKDPSKRITMSEILEHPFYKSHRSSEASHPTPSLDNISRSIADKSEIDQDIFANLRTLWHGIPDQQIIKNLTSDKQTWEKGVYHLLVEYRDRHLENYDPEEEEWAQRRSRRTTGDPKTPSRPEKQFMTRTTSRPARLGLAPTSDSSSEARNSNQHQSPAIILHSPSHSAVGSVVDSSPSLMGTRTSPATQVPLARSGTRSAPPDDVVGVQDDNIQRYFAQIVDHLNSMEIRSSASENTTVRRVPTENPAAPPPTPAGSRFVEHDSSSAAPSSDHWNFDDNNGPRSAHGIAAAPPVPPKSRRRPAPLNLGSHKVNEEDENYVMITPEDIDFPDNKTEVARFLTAAASPIASTPRSPLTDRRVQIVEPLEVRPSKLKKRSPAASPASPAFSDDSFFPPTSPSLSPPKRSWFGHLFKFKPASYQLLSMADVYVTREECRRLLIGMGIRVTHLRSPDGLDILRCTLDEFKDPAGMMEVAKAVQFRVEVQKPSYSQTIAGFTILLHLVQEKGALSSFRMMYNRLRREWDLDAPRTSMSVPLSSPTLSPGGNYAQTVYRL